MENRSICGCVCVCVCVWYRKYYDHPHTGELHLNYFFGFYRG